MLFVALVVLATSIWPVLASTLVNSTSPANSKRETSGRFPSGGVGGSGWPSGPSGGGVCLRASETAVVWPLSNVYSVARWILLLMKPVTRLTPSLPDVVTPLQGQTNRVEHRSIGSANAALNAGVSTRRGERTYLTRSSVSLVPCETLTGSARGTARAT